MRCNVGKNDDAAPAQYRFSQCNFSFSAQPSLRYHALMFVALCLIYGLIVLWVIWRHRSYLPDALVPGLLVLLTVAFYWRIVSGDVFAPADGGDLGSFLYPTYHFIQSSLREGVWPLWNPHLYSGTPFVGEVQSGILYPPHLLRFLVGPTLVYRDMQALAMLHVWWAGVGGYFLARGLRIGRAAAVFAAIAFMFSDVFIVHFGNLNLIAVLSWLPLALLGVHRTLEQGGWRPALGAGLALGIGTLAGHVQMTLFSLMTVALWVGLWLLINRDRFGELWRPALKAIAVPTVIAIGIMSPILLPGLQASALSARTDWSYAQAVGFSLSPAQLIGLIIPNFFGRGPMLHWGLWPRVEVGYIGILTLALAVMGVALRRDRLTWLLIGLASVSLAFSLGVYSIVHGWFTWLLPGLDQLRAPARFIFLFDLAVALLAARGLQAMMAQWTAQSRRIFDQVWRVMGWLLVLIVAIGLPVIYAILILTQTAEAGLHLRASVGAIALVGFALLYLASLSLLFARRREWVKPGLFAGLAILLLFIDLASLGAYEDISEQDPAANYNRDAVIQFLASDPDLYRIDARTDIDALWQPDTAMVHGLDDVWGVVNPLTLAHYEAFWESTGSRSSDLYALLNVKYLLGRKDVELDWDAWELAFDGDPELNVYRNRRVQPRALLLGQATPVPDLSAAQGTIRDAGFMPLRVVVLESGEAQSGAGGEAEILAWNTNDVLIRTESSEPGTLLVAQTWYPGWQARVDDGPWQPVLRADSVWQAVQLPPGQHEISMRFRSNQFVAGLIIAAVVLILALAGIALAGRGQQKRPSD
ncbi:MAG: YfhO family protein [Caldilineales bacterium]|nr:YfhO family protein [Caldilineales bacterium]